MDGAEKGPTSDSKGITLIREGVEMDQYLRANGGLKALDKSRKI